MAIVTTKAVVLRTKHFRETSLLVSIFTLDCGKIQGLIKGIRSKNSKYQSRLQPLTLNKVVFYQKKKSDLHLITQCELVEQFKALHQDLDKMAYASCCVELIDQIMQAEDENKVLFELLVDTLKQMCVKSNPDMVYMVFQIRLLGLLGYMPQLKFCANCGRKLAEALNFSSYFGGLLCAGCTNKDAEVMPISKGALASMVHIGGKDWGGIKRFQLTQKISQELKEPIEKFIKTQTQTELKSLDFIEKLKT